MWLVVIYLRKNRLYLFDLKETDFRGRRKGHRPPKEYVERKEQLSLCSVKELERELRRRKKMKDNGF